MDVTGSLRGRGLIGRLNFMMVAAAAPGRAVAGSASPALPGRSRARGHFGPIGQLVEIVRHNHGAGIDALHRGHGAVRGLHGNHLQGDGSGGVRNMGGVVSARSRAIISVAIASAATVLVCGAGASALNK